METVKELVQVKGLRYPSIEVPKVAERYFTVARELLAQQANKGNMEAYLHLACSNDPSVNLVSWYDGDELVGILLYSVGYTWWTDRAWVFEEGVIAMRDDMHGIQRKAMEALDTIAEEADAMGIAAGNLLSTNDTMVANGYMKHGNYDRQYSSFVKFRKVVDTNA